MRERLYITISDARQVRQFSVHNLVAKGLMYALSGHAVLVLAGLLALGWIAWEIDALNMARSALATEVQADAEAKSQERSQAESELADIEKQIQRKREELGIINRVTKPLPSSSSSGKVGAGVAQTLKPFLPLGAPLSGGQVSSSYGMRFHPIWMKNLFHNGIDFDIAKNTPVKATADGVVDAVTKSEDGFGVMVSLRHAFNFKTVYAHLDKTHVAEGQIVRKGEVIAASGNTGLSTAPHLHYEVRLDEKPLNPQPFLHAEAEGVGRLIKQARNAPWASLIASRHP